MQTLFWAMGGFAAGRLANVAAARLPALIFEGISPSDRLRGAAALLPQGGLALAWVWLSLLPLSAPRLVMLALLALGLMILGLIDARHKLLPDILTLPLLALGLAASFFGLSVTPAGAFAGAAAGYVIPAIISRAYRALAGKDGLGGGDFKLLALIGAWGGLSVLFPALFLASVAAVLFALGRRVVGKIPLTGEVAFGPWLCLAGFMLIARGASL